MRTDPILGTALYIEDGCTRKITAYGGLCYIRGNARPHFSLTGLIVGETEPDGPMTDLAGGCIHRELLAHFPALADLAALHLSDDSGVPMHAEVNGWYWLAGALGGMGDQYHGGNGTPPKSSAECLAILAEHARLGAPDLRALVAMIEDADSSAAARGLWREAVESMRPRWKSEADAAIALHGLKVYGDPFPG